MRNISAGNLALLQARQLVARDFLWIKARELGTGVPFNYGFWSDVGDVQAQVINPDTGLAVTRNFEGSGSLVQISDIPLVANITVQQVSISMSQLDPGVENIVRGYDLKQAGVEIYRGLLDVASRQLLVPALCRFVGFVDSVSIKTPKENDAGSIDLTCASHTQEMTRANPDTRSNDSQKRRSATDNFYQDVTTVGETEFFWGSKAGKITTKGSSKLATNVILRGA
ncbi:hypothetical protein N8E89_09310 [Phyllobacterium sp. A18/5-2]|uniref:hypothetical protein n=1 Tax=Phyllobacterium sp. A18/5-2 TaxID=2978392 RepID=UPI0021C9C333|nr:hypothetical protein [Phyllobacterium sp. A18/5-2]UXN62913.1 hypothetical protein N8E89_09310 [Phyllobacterium sp. A18/5-2]